MALLKISEEDFQDMLKASTPAVGESFGEELFRVGDGERVSPLDYGDDVKLA